MSTLVLLFLLVRLKIVRFNLFWKCSPAIVLVPLMFGLFIPMGCGAPSGPVLVLRNSAPIVPNVSGEIVEAPVTPNAPLKAGDILFRIDPTPFEYKVKELRAQVAAAQQKALQLQAEVDAVSVDVAALSSQVAFAEQRRDDVAKLVKSNTPTEFRLQDEEKRVDTLHAQLNAAKAHETSAKLAWHIIREVLLRQIAILNYVNPFQAV